jgi:hypothetical protein
VGDAAAQVAAITPALSALSIIDPVAAFTSSARAGTGEAAAAAVPEPTTTQAAETSRATSPAAAAGTGTAALPRTGVAVASLLVSAVTLLLLGVALRRFGLRPATVVGH